VKRLVAWVLGTYAGRLIQAYAASQAGNYARGLAFTAFVSTFPLILGLLAILGVAVSDPGVRAQFVGALLSFFPADSHAALTSAVDGIHRFSGLLGAIGIVGLLWSGGNLFTAMEWSLGRMIGARQRDFLHQRAMAAVMTVVYVVALVAVVGLNSALALAGAIPYLAPVAGVLVWIAFMAIVYRAVPNRAHRLSQSWPGAVLAGVLMEILTLLWPLYTRLVHGFSTYGAAFALFFLLASWLYFFAQFILLGAVVNRMYAGAPTARGLIAGPQPDVLVTEATRAADRQARRRPDAV